MNKTLEQSTELQEISNGELANVQGGGWKGKASEWVTRKFHQLFSKNVDEMTPGPRNKDFIDNAIRRPAPGQPPPGAPKGTGPAANDN